MLLHVLVSEGKAEGSYQQPSNIPPRQTAAPPPPARAVAPPGALLTEGNYLRGSSPQLLNLIQTGCFEFLSTPPGHSDIVAKCQTAFRRTAEWSLNNYGWIPHNAGFGFLDLAPSILHSNWFWDYIS
jgi:hypothetical protein